LLGTAQEAAPGLESLEIGRYVETSEDLAERTGAINGCIYHVDHVPTRMGPLRPAVGAGGYRTPLAGLYLGSAGCHPGGGVSGLPGKLCAETVLKDVGARGAQPPDVRSGTVEAAVAASNGAGQATPATSRSVSTTA
jgi:phytoene dehydrogenase-like protein